MFQPVSHAPRSGRDGARHPAPVAGAVDLRAAPRAERGRAALELPRRPDHGQQPDGRPSRLGPDLQGPVPALPRDARRGPALAERLRLPGPVGRGQRRAGPGVQEQARHRGLRHRRVRLALQAARPDLRRRARPSSPSASGCGWTGTIPTSCAGCATSSPTIPQQVTTIQGPDGPVTDTVEMLVGRLGMPDVGRLATSPSRTRTTT